MSIDLETPCQRYSSAKSATIPFCGSRSRGACWFFSDRAKARGQRKGKAYETPLLHICTTLVLGFSQPSSPASYAKNHTPLHWRCGCRRLTGDGDLLTRGPVWVSALLSMTVWPFMPSTSALRRAQLVRKLEFGCSAVELLVPRVNVSNLANVFQL